MIKKRILIIVSILAAGICSAQTGSIRPAGELSEKELQETIKYCKTNLPKFWSVMTTIRNRGVDVEISKEKKRGPGRARGTNRIIINHRYIVNDLPSFPEDRLIIVLFHEFGHVLFNRKTPRNQRSPEKNEFAAFSYSLKMAKILAKQGDHGPLEQVVKYLKIRSKSKNIKSPHTQALKRLLKTPLWDECIDLHKSINQANKSL